ncbi:multiple sugar transport permease [Pyrobaculum aerophilum str. IM2]|uniref:Multiple sugar transport permease n=2 Tax=Pyrobaculum aerophilum TaxID=13773 RepID=Q8ZXE5_PYRAE|nr:carbohydrate ABC transporter permease [Pyrobaculum aerophilum]AAL63403.1 multiple sugar transport permease [Pyrobaculum aerophilum str. IM2]HII47661.1 carbohydrate ABC transporter permease [Pyrobaculum aerophilum]
MKATRILFNIAVWAFAAFWVLPFVGVIMLSILPYREVVIQGWLRVPDPESITLKNYLEALFNPVYDLATGLRNSLLVASLATLIALFAASLFAYAFVNLPFRMKTFLFMIIIFIMMAPQQISVVPLFFLYLQLGLYDSLPGIILLHSAWGTAWATFFLRNYFALIPRSLVEAAWVDGARDWQIFRRIVLPLAKPGLIAAALLQYTWVWNDLFYALVFLSSNVNQVITQKVVFLKGEFHVDWGLLSAGSVLSMSIPLVLYVLFNKYFARGVAGWGVKR